MPPEESGTAVAERTVERTEAGQEAAEEAGTDTPWQAVVWDDPVNLMSYVTYVFQRLFGYGKDHATRLMLDVHQKGRAVVSSGAREKIEGDVTRLHAAGLWATMQHPS